MTRGDTVRFQSLDILRGAAALSVTLFHCVNSHPGVSASLIGGVLLYGWIGVFLFFPVSGYCICAAIDRSGSSGAPQFLWRRWLRIVPAYWVSVVLAVAIALAALPFNRSSVADVALSAPQWASVLTLTQVLAGWDGLVNPVYWSLAYEAQFYVVMALVLLVRSEWRPAIIAVSACIAAAYLTVSSLHVSGLFLNYWLNFAVGCAAYVWLHRPAARAMALVTAAAALVAAIARMDIALAVSLACGVVMVMLAAADARVAAARVSLPLVMLGEISYSLYLTHVPIGGRVVNLLARFDVPLWRAGGSAAAISIAAAALFYAAVERPLNASSRRARTEPRAGTIEMVAEELAGRA